MLEILQTADIFLFPSYQEGLPMALLEAMASGLPVICSDIRGSQDLMGEVLSQTDTAKVCSGGIMIKKADDVSAYSQAIRHLLDTPNHLPARLRELGQNNRRLSEAFSSDSVVKKNESHLRKAVQGIIRFPCTAFSFIYLAHVCTFRPLSIHPSAQATLSQLPH